MRILFVGIPNSVHVARWINQLGGLGWDLHLFPVWDAPIHPMLRDTTTYGVSSARPRGMHPSIRVKGMWPLQRGTRLIRGLAGTLAPTGLGDRVRWLARVIDRIKPDLIHSIEFQHCSYMVQDAKRHVRSRFPLWAITNYGHDIYLYSRLAEHRPRIQALLQECDYYTCECERDLVLARELGFSKDAFPVFPNTGGFDLERLESLRQPGPVSQRRLVLLKGYQHYYGRALMGLKAIALCADALRGYQVCLHSVNSDNFVEVERVAQRTGVVVRYIQPCSNEEMMHLHGHSRVSMGVNISDAASISMLEALIMGSFPMQTCTSCADEWLVHGQTGMIVPPGDPHEIAACLRRALTDDALVNSAAERNGVVARERLSRQVIQPQVIAAYRRIEERVERERGFTAQSSRAAA